MQNTDKHTGNFIYENKQVLQNYAYYPFGMEMNGFNFTSTNTLKNNYLYNGKELQEDFGLGWYSLSRTCFGNYGARFYDAEVGRFYSVDPMADIFYDLSPYNYVANNPLIFIDPDGMLIDDYTLNKKTGEVKLVKETDDTYDRILETNRKGEVKRNKDGEAKVAIDKIEKEF